MPAAMVAQQFESQDDFLYQPNGMPPSRIQIDPKAVGAPLARRSSNPPQLITDVLNGHRKLDRCQSEPVDNKNQNSSRYKTELCRPFQENGTCKYGDKCQFAHGTHELRNLSRHPKYKTELCRTFHTIGFCPYGPRCHFVHNEEEAAAKKCNQMLNLQINGHRPLDAAKSLNVPMYSGLGSTADSPSPSSSLSESPTQIGTFFAEDYYAFSPSPATNTAFNFTPDMTTAMPMKTKLAQYNRWPLHDSPVIQIPGNTSPPSSRSSDTGSLASDLDQLSISPAEIASPLRLPVFSRLAEA